LKFIKQISGNELNVYELSNGEMNVIESIHKMVDYNYWHILNHQNVQMWMNMNIHQIYIVDMMKQCVKIDLDVFGQRMENVKWWEIVIIQQNHIVWWIQFIVHIQMENVFLIQIVEVIQQNKNVNQINHANSRREFVLQRNKDENKVD